MILPLREMMRPRQSIIREGVAQVGVLGAADTMARKIVVARVRGWTSSLGRIFGVDVIKCARFSGRMRAFSSAKDDSELKLTLLRGALEVDLPMTSLLIRMIGRPIMVNQLPSFPV